MNMSAGRLFRLKQRSPRTNRSRLVRLDYEIGPAAYAFISYSHWHEPSYARYIERSERKRSDHQ